MCWKIAILILTISFFACEKTIIESEDTMEILDVLSHYDDRALQFTVNTAVPFVQASQPVILLAGVMSDKEGKYYFPAGDNFQIISLGFVLPMGFEIYKTEKIGTGIEEPPALSVFAINRLNVIIPISPESVYVPFANYELNFGTFYSGINQDVRIEMTVISDLFVSMVGVPAALNGETFKMPVFAKVLHNSNLIP
jgi:hypothetical protein